MSVYKPEDFAGDYPPERIMGTEMEYMIPESGHNNDLISQVLARARMHYGTSLNHQTLKNGSRLYKDMGCIEYATPECLGPAQVVEAEMAGEEIVKTTFQSICGDSQALYRRTGGYGGEGMKSVGYHQNLLTVPYERLRDQQQDAQVVGAYAVSRVIWHGNGMLKRHYVLSQKAHDIGMLPEQDILCVGGYGYRTASAGKPILAWSSHNRSSMESFTSGWERLELRYSDAPHSPWTRFMGMATASLVLRLLEHKNMFPERVWDDIKLHDLPSSVREMTNDINLRRSYETQSGDQATALSLQMRLAEMAVDVSTKISLPRDEVAAAHEWVKVCQDIDDTKGSMEARMQRLSDRVEWAARLRLLRRQGERLQLSHLHRRNAGLAAVDLVWDQITPRSTAQDYWRRQQADFYAKHEAGIAEQMVTAPRFTRAHVRSRLVQKSHMVREGQWNQVQRPGGGVVRLDDPYDYGG